MSVIGARLAHFSDERWCYSYSHNLGICSLLEIPCIICKKFIMCRSSSRAMQWSCDTHPKRTTIPPWLEYSVSGLRTTRARTTAFHFKCGSSVGEHVCPRIWIVCFHHRLRNRLHSCDTHHPQIQQFLAFEWFSVKVGVMQPSLSSCSRRISVSFVPSTRSFEVFGRWW